jgi:hypothetical protein
MGVGPPLKQQEPVNDISDLGCCPTRSPVSGQLYLEIKPGDSGIRRLGLGAEVCWNVDQ